MRNTMLVVGAALVATAVVVATAAAAKTGPGVSTGVGSVFVSNPVQSLGDESLTDQKDSDAAVSASAYHDVTLTNLDGSGFLRGDYANVVSETGNPAFSPANTFRYTRHQDEFEQVMAYSGSRSRRSTSTAAASARSGAESTTGRKTCTSDLHYPTDLNCRVHHDGQIWSRALWGIRLALGHVTADTIILQGSFDFPGTTMTALANSTVAAAQSLYGAATANVVRQAFVNRRILS